MATPNVKLADSNIIVKAEKVNKYFGSLHVLKDIDIEVRKNEVVVIIGPSGSGKRPSCAASIIWKRSTADTFMSTAT